MFGGAFGGGGVRGERERGRKERRTEGRKGGKKYTKGEEEVVRDGKGWGRGDAGSKEGNRKEKERRKTDGWMEMNEC